MSAVRFLELLTLVGIVTVGVACNDSSVQPFSRPDPPIFDPDQTEFSDQELWAAVYSSFKYPPGFYTEEYEGAAPYYVNTFSITPISEREPPRLELCTNEYEHAHDWTDLSIENSSVVREVIAESQTDKYFEFLARFPESGSGGVRFRVHKCGYLDRSACNWLTENPLLGKFNQRPITESEVRELSEYLFFLDSHELLGFSALSSISYEETNAHTQTIYNATFIGGDWGTHDQIDLNRWTYSIDKETGEITLVTEMLRRISGRYHANSG